MTANTEPMPTTVRSGSKLAGQEAKKEESHWIIGN